MKSLYRVLCVTLLVMGMAWTSHAAVVTIPDSALVSSTRYYTDTIGGGIGNTILDRNDDSYVGPVNLGFSLSFFGNTYTQTYINNNGNISFGNGISSYTPNGPQGAPQPIISPFFADVDTRNPASGVVHLRNDIPNEFIVTWDQVGYYGYHADKLDSFQLVLRGSAYPVPVGEGPIGFFYRDMQWETGDASGGSGGFGGHPAAVGFGDGSSNGEVLDGSLQNGISGIVNNHHIWFDQDLTPVPDPPSAVPEPSVMLLMGAGLAGWAGFMRKRKVSKG